jgi:enoyl-CoA hydratase
MTELPQILIAAIDGLAVGGGFVCACACDIRIATHNAKLGLPEVKLGWPPNYGLQIVQSIVGRANALRLAVSGEPISSSEAQRLGAVHEIIPAFRLREEARQLAEAVLALPPESVAATKQLFSLGSDGRDELATQSFLNCLQTKDARISIDKFSGQ